MALPDLCASHFELPRKHTPALGVSHLPLKFPLKAAPYIKKSEDFHKFHQNG